MPSSKPRRRLPASDIFDLLILGGQFPVPFDRPADGPARLLQILEAHRRVELDTRPESQGPGLGDSGDVGGAGNLGNDVPGAQAAILDEVGCLGIEVRQRLLDDHRQAAGLDPLVSDIGRHRDFDQHPHDWTSFLPTNCPNLWFVLQMPVALLPMRRYLLSGLRSR